MQTIRLTTLIDAPPQRCFLLSLSIDLHTACAGDTAEQAVEGKTSGLLQLGDAVTWSGRHFGLRLRHRSRIDLWRPYTYFRDLMVSGHFAHFEHDHHFASMNDGTRMRDEVRFSAPFGILGRPLEGLLRRRLRSFLKRRNARIKQAAESEEWRRYLDHQPPLDLTRSRSA